MIRSVRIVPQALGDLEDIHSYLLAKEGPGLAGKILNGIEHTVLSLSNMAQRGHCLPELEGLGFTNIREVHFKPYRIVFLVDKKEVTVLIVADGRRDFRDLLSRRLVR